MTEKKEGKVRVGAGEDERGGRRAWEPPRQVFEDWDDERRLNIPQRGFPAFLPCSSLCLPECVPPSLDAFACGVQPSALQCNLWPSGCLVTVGQLEAVNRNGPVTPAFLLNTHTHTPGV